MTSSLRIRTPILAASSVLLGLLVVGGVLLAGRLGLPDTSTSSASAAAGAPATTQPAPSPTDPRSTPEGAARAFFAAYALARRSDDPSAVAGLVTGPDSSAYRSVAGFLEGQRAAGKASVLTVARLEGLAASVTASGATVTFDYTEGGYDIGLADASPLQTPQLLPSVRVTVRLRQVGGVWLVDAYESVP